MTDDRALLEAAAKAAGMTTGAVNDCVYELRDGELYAKWNPLEDDGDALRLAVKLGIAVELHPAWVYARAVSPDDHMKWMEITEGWGSGRTDRKMDPYAATRRAIVRAAAASLSRGERMEG